MTTTPPESPATTRTVDVEAALLDVFDDLGVAATTFLRVDPTDPTGDDLSSLPLVWVEATDGAEVYGVFRTDPVVVHCFAATRSAARDLAALVLERVADGPKWTPHGLLDSFEVLDGPARQPWPDSDVHLYDVQLGVETRSV